MLGFLAEAVLISLSGVMAPGPLTTTAVANGGRSPHAGGLVALGHGIVELPLMLAVFWGLGELLAERLVRDVVGLIGGFFLLGMGIGMLRAASTEGGAAPGSTAPFLAGALLSLGNPYFLVWWVTVGAALISRSLQFGPLGFVAFAVLHWSCDLGWLYLLSFLAFRGRELLGARFFRPVHLICGGFLLFLGGKFMFDSVQGLLGGGG